MYGLSVTISSIALTKTISSTWIGSVSGTVPLPISNAVETSTVSFTESGVNYFSASVSTVSFGFGSVTGSVYIYKCGTGWYVTGNAVLSVDTSGFGSTLSGLPSGPYNVNMFRSCDGSSWGASVIFASAIRVTAISGSAISFTNPALTYTRFSSGVNTVGINGTLLSGSIPILKLAASLSRSSGASTTAVAVGATQIGSVTLNNVYSAITGKDFAVEIPADPTNAFSAVKNVAVSNTALSFDLVSGSGQRSFCASLSLTLSGFAGKNAAINAGLRGCSSGSTPAIFFYVQADLSNMNLGPVQNSVNQLGDLKIASPAIVLSFGSFAGTLATSLPDIDPSFSMSTVLTTVSNLAPSGSVSLVGGISFAASANAQSGFSSFINQLSTIQGGQFKSIANMMTLSSSTFKINFNVVMATSGVFSAIINFQNFPLSFGGVQLSSFQLQQSISPTSASYSLLIAVSFSVSGQPLVAVGQFGFTQFGIVSALGATIQIASGALTGLSTSSSSSYVTLLPGQSIWMNPFNAGPRVGIILPITLGIVMGVTDTVPPLPAPLQIQFSGGFVIGRTAGSIALQVNIPNMQIALAATLNNFNIGNLIEDMVGCTGCFGSASTFLSKFFSVQSLFFSFNPTPNAISVGTTISSIVIPPGLTLSVADLWVFDIFHIQNGLFQFNAGGLTADLTFAPIVLIPNYVELRSAPSVSVYQRYGLNGGDIGMYYPPSADPSFCHLKCVATPGCVYWMYGGPECGITPSCWLKTGQVSAFGSNCVYSEKLDPGTTDSNNRGSPSGPTMQLSIPTNAGPSAYISAGAYIFGTTLGLRMTLNQDSSFSMIATMVDPSLVNLGISMNGYTYNPATWSATISASVNPQIIAQALAAGLPVITNAFNNVVNQMNNALSAFNNANNALSSAQNTLNDAQSQVNSAVNQIQNAQNSVNSQRNCYYDNMNAISDCTRWANIWCGFSCNTWCNPVHCSWGGCNGGDCHSDCWDNYCWISYQDPDCLWWNAYHSGVAGVCWSAWQSAQGTLDWLSNSISQAANAALSAASGALSAAQSVVSSTRSAYQAATNAVGNFAGALTSGIQWFIQNALSIQSITLTATVSRSQISGSITIVALIGSSSKTWTLSTGNAFAGITPDAIASMVVSNCQSFLSSIGVTVRRLQETPSLDAPSADIHQTLAGMPESVRTAVQGILSLDVPTVPQYFDASSATRSFSYADILNQGPVLVGGLTGASTFAPPALINVTFTSTVNTYVNTTILSQNALASVWVDPATAAITVGSLSYFLPGTPANITDNTCYNGVCGMAALPLLKLVDYIPNDSYLCNLALDVSSIRLSKLARAGGASGPLPSCVAKYNATAHFSCTNCFITGSVNAFTATNSQAVLSSLVLANNYLSGTIPSNLSTVLPSLRTLNVQNNYLGGDLSFLLNSKISAFHVDGNQFTEPNVPYLLSTMTSVSEFSMIQPTFGIPYVSRVVVPPTTKTRVVVVLNIQPNFTSLCGAPAGSNVGGVASVCHLDSFPMNCANAFCSAGAAVFSCKSH
jgi:exonuclease VII small subunit